MKPVEMKDTPEKISAGEFIVSAVTGFCGGFVFCAIVTVLVLWRTA